MTLWVILTIMTSVTAVLVSAPFLRRLDEQGATTSAGDVAVYLDQLIELEREAAAGLIDGEQTEAARAEIKRRIVTADRAPKPLLMRLSPAERNLVVVGVAGIVILGSVGLYASSGSPTLPSTSAQPTPLAQLERTQEGSALAAATTSPQTSETLQPGSAQQRVLGSVDEMMDRLVSRLNKNPKDLEGWRMLGWSYFHTDRFAEAATAYARARELSPNNAELTSAYGEALVKAADDHLTDQAKALFEKALQLDPKDGRARFFMGLAKEQAGDGVSALNDWIAVLNETESNEPWFAKLRERVTELGHKLGIDVSTRLHNQSTAATGGVLRSLEQSQSIQVGSQKGPTPEDVRNAEAMPAADRAAMIHNMVDGLAARLEKSPGDVEGWVKLIRARKVLGETNLAEQALGRALDQFKDAPEERSKIVAIGQDLGLMQ